MFEDSFAQMTLSRNQMKSFNVIWNQCIVISEQGLNSKQSVMNENEEFSSNFYSQTSGRNLLGEAGAVRGLVWRHMVVQDLV